MIRSSPRRASTWLNPGRGFAPERVLQRKQGGRGPNSSGNDSRVDPELRRLWSEDPAHSAPDVARLANTYRASRRGETGPGMGAV